MDCFAYEYINFLSVQMIINPKEQVKIRKAEDFFSTKKKIQNAYLNFLKYKFNFCRLVFTSIL
jgi:hypothetical protein